MALGVSTSITALVLTKKYREEMREEHLREIKAADDILPPPTTQSTLFQQQHERAASIHSKHSTEGFSISALETTPKEKASPFRNPGLSIRITDR